MRADLVARTWLMTLTLVAASGCSDDPSPAAAGGSAGSAIGNTGSGAALVFGEPEVIAFGQSRPRKLTANASLVYWTVGDTITAAAHDGSGAAIVVTATKGIHDLLADDSHVYWLDDDRVMRLSSSGGVEEVVAKDDGDFGNLALDDTHVYWTSGGTIARALKTGGAREVLATNITDPEGVAVDDQRVYFSDGHEGTVRAVPKAGGDLEVLAHGQRHPRRVVAQQDAIVWGTEDEVMRLNKAGGSPEVLAANRSVPSWAIATDSRHVYYANTDNHTIERVPKSGGAIDLLADAQGSPNGLTLVGNTLFWVSPDKGAVVRLVGSAN